MEITKKVAKVVLYKANAFKGNDSYNVFMEGDEKTRYSYLCQGEPKIKVGDTGPFIVEQQGEGASIWWKIKVPKEDGFGKGTGAGFRQKPDHVIALEWARKMMNSSHKTKDKWDTDKMLKTASFFLKKLKAGEDRDVIETATIIACSDAMDGIVMNPEKLVTDMTSIKTWIEGNK